MFKLILNIVLLNILSAPCFLVFNDIDPITGEWNWGLNLMGVVYIIWFVRNIVNPIFKSSIDDN